jgi:hypothetical protein
MECREAEERRTTYESVPNPSHDDERTVLFELLRGLIGAHPGEGEFEESGMATDFEGQSNGVSSEQPSGIVPGGTGD